MLDINSQIIDPEILLEKVRRNVLNKNIQNQEQGTVENFKCAITVNGNIGNLVDEYRKNLYRVSMFKEITDPEIISFRSNFKTLRILVKKLMKKLTFWIIKPYWEQQNMYNDAVLESLKKLEQINSALLKEVQE